MSDTLEIVSNDDAIYEHIKEIIQEESQKFVLEIFSFEFELVESHTNFIEENELFIPYENYLFTKEILLEIFKVLKMNDVEFASTTLAKLNKEIEFLDFKYKEFKKNIKNVKLLFSNNLASKSDIIYYLNSEIINFKKHKNLSENMQKELQSLEKMFYKFKHYYLLEFSDIYFEYKTYIEDSFKQILNSYLLYFEKLMWIEAKKSEKIVEKFNVLSIKNLDTKSYLIYQLKVMQPYSSKYNKYLKALRNYK